MLKYKDDHIITFDPFSNFSGTGRAPQVPLKGIDIFKPSSIWETTELLNNARDFGELLIDQVRWNAFIFEYKDIWSLIPVLISEPIEAMPALLLSTTVMFQDINCLISWDGFLSSFFFIRKFELFLSLIPPVNANSNHVEPWWYQCNVMLTFQVIDS